MRHAATVALLGESGPYSQELSAHREIEVIRAADEREMAQLLKSSLLDIVVVSPSHAALATRINFPPDLPVLVLARNQAAANALLSANCSFAVRPVDQVRSIVRVLEEITGIRMAKDIRIEAQVSVAIVVNGARYLRTSTDLSLSGIGVRRFPDAMAGARVEIVVALPNGPLFLEAQVVRSATNKDGEAVSGLSFVSVDTTARARLSEAIELLMRHGHETLASLVCTELPQLRALVLGNTTIEAPRWMLDLVGELTPLELTAARGGSAPEWAVRGLPLWLEAARCRAHARRAA